MKSKTELLFGLVVIGFAWASLFGHWWPVPVQSLLFIIVLILEVVMIVAAWWCWIKNRNAEPLVRWRKGVGLLGVIANTAALAIPVGSLLYIISYRFIRVRMRLPIIDGQWIMLTCLMLSVCGLIAGILAPPRSRLPTTLAALIIGLITLSIPMGVL